MDVHCLGVTSYVMPYFRAHHIGHLGGGHWHWASWAPGVTAGSWQLGRIPCSQLAVKPVSPPQQAGKWYFLRLRPAKKQLCFIAIISSPEARRRVFLVKTLPRCLRIIHSTFWCHVRRWPIWCSSCTVPAATHPQTSRGAQCAARSGPGLCFRRQFRASAVPVRCRPALAVGS